MQVDTGTERIVCAATEATGRAIQSAGASLRSPFRESEMQRVFVHELRASLATVDLEVAPQEAFKVVWPVWPGVGPVDVALVEPDGTRRAFLELKWGAGTLYNCIWDLAKMATAVTIPEAATAFLIAGAPDTDWAGADGAECFSSGTHSLVELFEQYPKHWRFWLNDVKTHPAHLPRLVSTTQVAAVPVEVRGEAWTIRCVNVAAAADTGRWWTVGPVEEELGIRDRPAPSIGVPEGVDLTDSPHPTESEMQTAEDYRRFDRGDSAALWRLVRNPPRWWRFIWFPGDVDFVGKTLEESWGTEQAELLTITKAIKTQEDLTKAVAAVEEFVGTHCGDPTAISAARNCVYAERSLGNSEP